MYIHIGTHKTGTTAIQDFLSLNKKVLSKKRILFPQKSRRDYWEKFDGHYVITPSKATNFVKLAKICHIKCKHVIVSSETFSLINDVSVIGNLFKNTNVKIICYLRRQDELQQSMYNQSVKAGYFEDIAAYDEYPLDYWVLLNRWANAFGKNNIIVRIYDKQQLKNNSLIEDFLEIFNLELTKEFQLPKGNSNPRLCPEALEYMKLLNRISREKKITDTFYKMLVKYSVQNRTDSACSYFADQYLLDFKKRVALIKQYHNSNALVAREYLNRHDGQLFDENVTEYSREETPHQNILDEEVTLQITEFLWQNRESRKALERTIKMVSVDADQYVQDAKGKILAAIQQIIS